MKNACENTCCVFMWLYGNIMESYGNTMDAKFDLVGQKYLEAKLQLSFVLMSIYGHKWP